MNGRNIIGKRVRLARKAARPPVTQADLAARLQVQGIKLDRVAISKIEIGYREVTDVEVSGIAKALGVPLNWLFDEDK